MTNDWDTRFEDWILIGVALVIITAIALVIFTWWIGV
jgi:hypothetical protein